MLLRFIKPVHAHCDIPCGIYEVDTMRYTAETCLKMVQKIEEMDVSGEKSDAHANYIRMVMNKEKHAQLCKDQIYLLWSDYFTREHVQKFPDLHDVMWQAAKQCSKVKQSISRSEAEMLVSMVGKITNMFEESKR